MSRMLEELYETARGLHKSGVIDKKSMRECEVLYRAHHASKLAAKETKKLREQQNLSE